MANETYKDIEKLERNLWAVADNLRANSKLTSSDYFMPVLGVIFLRHTANRFEAAQRQIQADQASGNMPKRKIQPADYIARCALFLPLVLLHASLAIRVFISAGASAWGNAAAIAVFIVTAAGLVLIGKR